jgi:glycogen synthase
MSQPRIAFVSRELYPFRSAGLGNYVLFTAAALADVAEVTVLTSDAHEAAYRELVAAGDPRIPAGVRIEFVPEARGTEADYWYHERHLWSARAYEAVLRVYPDGGPDLVEFPDYLGEGAVTAQAIQTADRALRNTAVCVRAYTTYEMCQVLDGFVAPDRDVRMLFELERYALANADYFLWPGGGVLDTYREFFGERLAGPALVPHTAPAAARPRTAPDPEGPTRFLYVGRLERRKGVGNLIRAAVSLGLDDWSLTLIGADTPTAPLAQSMRDQLELMIAEDPRIELAGPVPRDELSSRYEAADVCVSPSLWECWPNTVLEALDHNRPVIATPVGGHLGMIEEGRSGWLTADTGVESLAVAMERAISDPDAVRGVGRGPGERFEELTGPEPVRERYLELAEARAPGRGWSTRSPATPLVSVVVPYFRMEAHLEETLASIRAQTHPRIEVILVNDGSLREQDAVVDDLADRYDAKLVAQPNSGLGAARNLGMQLARGRYVLPVDPDDLLLGEFVERCVDVLERRPELAYVTSWTEFIGEDGSPHAGGYRPIGNAAGYLDAENVAGSSMALLRRRLFERGLRYSEDMTSYEDWLLFLELRDRGLFGHVIPEPLLRYRVRDASMLRGVTPGKLALLRGELEAHRREAALRWTPSS